jgi:hypothetical protein
MRGSIAIVLLTLGACASSHPGDGDTGGDEGASESTTPTTTSSSSASVSNEGEGDASSSAPEPSSSEGGETTGPAQPSPELAIVFPPSGATAEATIVVRGTASHDGPIDGVTVNRVAATSTNDFADWRAEVPLDEGDNPIDARMQTDDGEIAIETPVVVTRFADAAAIVRGEGFAFADTDLRGVDIDVDAGVLYSADSIYDGVLQVEIGSGDRSWATCSESTPACRGGGGGVEMTDPLDVAFVAARGQALVPDGDALFVVDLATKDRAVASNGDVGSGPAMIRAAGIAYDIDMDRAIVLDWEGAQVLSIDLATGDRTLVASDDVGGGVQVYGLGAIEGDFARNRVVATRAYSDDLFVLDLTTGDREVLDGSGPALTEPSSIVVAGDTLFVVSDARIFAIDLPSGAREVIASAEVGQGPALDTVHALGFGRALLWARIDGAELAIDPIEGHRIYISR